MNEDTATRFRRAIEDRDLDGMLAMLSPGAMLHSPAAAGLTFRGRDRLAELFTQTLALYEDQRLTGPVSAGSTHILTIDARIGGQWFQESLVIEVGDDGLITELRPYIRPLAGLVAVAAAVGQGLAAQRGHATAIAFKGLMGPLVPMTRHGERFAVRLLANGPDGAPASSGSSRSSSSHGSDLSRPAV